MTEILFYHLERHPLERVLPVLIEKSLGRGWRVVVETGSTERLQRLDETLWTYRDDSFLPHGVAGGPGEADQPVLLTTEPGNANRADIRFYVDRAVPESVDGYQRIVFLFDGHDPDAIAEARAAWKALRDGNDLTYWQQDANGRWEKKAGA
ncbi:MAG: DNA polymerase III subunit chi [Alphaproteobacteria bacterium]|nr:DNA polymerase III subunit chi [Alphaproteobacteria bacterium]